MMFSPYLPNPPQVPPWFEAPSPAVSGGAAAARGAAELCLALRRRAEAAAAARRWGFIGQFAGSNNNGTYIYIYINKINMDNYYGILVIIYNGYNS